MECAKVQEFVERNLHLLEPLSREEKGAVVAHLAGCFPCSMILKESRALEETLPRALQIETPVDLWSKISHLEKKLPPAERAEILLSERSGILGLELTGKAKGSPRHPMHIFSWRKAAPLLAAAAVILIFLFSTMIFHLPTETQGDGAAYLFLTHGTVLISHGKGEARLAHPSTTLEAGDRIIVKGDGRGVLWLDFCNSIRLGSNTVFQVVGLRKSRLSSEGWVCGDLKFFKGRLEHGRIWVEGVSAAPPPERRSEIVIQLPSGTLSSQGSARSVFQVEMESEETTLTVMEGKVALKERSLALQEGEMALLTSPPHSTWSMKEWSRESSELPPVYLSLLSSRVLDPWETWNLRLTFKMIGVAARFYLPERERDEE